MSNPFMINTSTQSPIDLAPLGQGLAKFFLKKRLSDIKQRAIEAYKSGDPDKIAQFKIENPEFSKLVDIQALRDFTNERTYKNAKDSVYEFLRNPTRATLEKVVAERKALLDKEGVPPENRKETDSILDDFERDPAEVVTRLEQWLAHYDTDAYTKYREALKPFATSDGRPNSQKELEYYMRLRAFDPELAEKYAQKIGLNPKTPDSDAARYAANAVRVFQAEHPNATPEELAQVENDAMLKYRRAQAGEVYATTAAKEQAETEAAQEKAHRAETGKLLAQIAKNTELIHSKGELTPNEKKDVAAKKVTHNLARLAGYFNKLRDMGEIVDIEKPSLHNFWAAAKSSKAGQAIGRWLGTDAQTLRNAIQAMRPLILNDVRQATDMSARGLDSERELDFYLKAATDETRDIQSNIAAIIVLDETYGKGEVAKALKKAGLSPEYMREMENIRRMGRKIANGAFLPEDIREQLIKEKGDSVLIAPPGVSEDAIQYTMKKYGISRYELFKRKGWL